MKPRPEVLIAKGFLRLINALQICSDLKRPIKEFDVVAMKLAAEIENYEIEADRYDTKEF